MEDLSEMYSRVIKLSSENKINTTNSWKLSAFIERIDELMNIDATSEMNFQKASCTLDASVKIYSYRVDDTYTSSYRILENLHRNASSDEEFKAQIKEKKTSKKLF